MSFFAQVSDRWYRSHRCSCRFDAVEIMVTVFRRQEKNAGCSMRVCVLLRQMICADANLCLDMLIREKTWRVKGHFFLLPSWSSWTMVDHGGPRRPTIPTQVAANFETFDGGGSGPRGHIPQGSTFFDDLPTLDPIYPYRISLSIIRISQYIPKLRTRSLKTIEVRHSYAVVVRFFFMPPGALQLHSAADQLRWLRWPQWYQSTQGTSQQLGGIGFFARSLVTRIKHGPMFEYSTYLNQWYIKYIYIILNIMCLWFVHTSDLYWFVLSFEVAFSVYLKRALQRVVGLMSVVSNNIPIIQSHTSATYVYIYIYTYTPYIYICRYTL